MDNDIITIKCTKEQKSIIIEALHNSKNCIFKHSCNGRSCQKCLEEFLNFELKISCNDCFNKNICKLACDTPIDDCLYFKAIPDRSESK